MAGFGDFLQAIQFGMGIVSGFTAQAQKEREANEANQLKLLQMLQKDETSRVVPVSSEDIDRPTDFMTNMFGGGRARVRSTGEPATVFGGQGFALREYPPIQIPAELLTPSTPTAPAKPSEPSGPPAPPARPLLRQPAQPPSASVPSTEAPAGKTVAERHNNPLNIKLGPLTQKYVDQGLAAPGDAATDGGRFLRFTSPEAGAQAARELLKEPVYANKTVHDALQLWSNRGYGGEIVRGQVDPRTRVADLTPEQQTTMLQRMAEKEKGGSVRPNLFAGLGATATRTAPTPEAPERIAVPEIPLDPPRTEQSYIQDYQRRVYRTLAPRLRQTPKGEERLGVALKDAEKEAKNDYNKDFERARAEAKRIKSERQIHSFEALNALDRVQDTQQLKTILDYMAAHPDPDHLGDAVNMVRKAPESERAALAVRLYPQLLQANYPERVIEYALKAVLPSDEMKKVHDTMKLKHENRRVALVEARKLWNAGDKDAARDVLAVYEITGENVPTDMRQARLVEEQTSKITTAANLRHEEQTPLVETLVTNPALIPAFRLTPTVTAQILPRLVAGGVTKDDLYDPIKRDKEKLDVETMRFALDEKTRKKEGRFTEPEKAEHLKELRGLLLREPLFRQYSEATQGFVSILTGIKLDNAQGDLAIINGIVKMLDPTGVVRPSEFMTAEQAQGALERLGRLPAKFMEGDRLHPEARKRFLELATELNQGRFKVMHDRLETTYKSMTEPLGMKLDTLLDVQAMTGVTGVTDQGRITMPVPQQAPPEQTKPSSVITPEQEKYLRELTPPR